MTSVLYHIVSYSTEVNLDLSLRNIKFPFNATQNRQQSLSSPKIVTQTKSWSSFGEKSMMYSCIFFAEESVRVIADRVGLRGLLHSLAIRCVIQTGGQRKVTQEWVLLPQPVHLHLSHSYTNTHAQRHYTVQSPDESFLVCLISQRERRERRKTEIERQRSWVSRKQVWALLRTTSHLTHAHLVSRSTHTVP